MIPVPVCMIFCVDSESAIKTRFKAFWDFYLGGVRLDIATNSTVEISKKLGFTGSVFKDCSLKTSRQAPAATAWEKKTKVNNIKNNTKVKKK